MAQRVKRLPAMRDGFYLWVGKIPWRRKWQPTPVLLPGKSHGWRSLVGYSPWGHKESDMTEQLHFHFHVHRVGDAIEPFHPQSYPSPLAFSLSQHQDRDAHRFCIIFVDPITLHFRSPFLYTLIPCLGYVRYVSGVSFFLELFLCSSPVA